jgi:hypothetical protein
MFELIQISQGIKTFVLKALLGKPFQTFHYYSLKNLFEKIRIQNTILYLINPMCNQTYASLFAKEIYTNDLC